MAQRLHGWPYRLLVEQPLSCARHRIMPVHTLDNQVLQAAQRDVPKRVFVACWQACLGKNAQQTGQLWCSTVLQNVCQRSTQSCFGTSSCSELDLLVAFDLANAQGQRLKGEPA